MINFPSINTVLQNITKVSLGALGPIAVLIPHNIIIIFIIIALCGIPYINWQNVGKIQNDKILLSIGLLWFWATYTNLWTPHPLEGLILSAKLLGIVVLGWTIRQLFKQTHDEVFIVYLKYLAFGLIFALFFILIDNLLGSKWHAIKEVCITKAFAQTSMTIALALWPTLGLLPKQKNFLLILIVLCLWPVECDSGTYGLILGLIVTIIADSHPNFTIRQFKIITPISFLLFPIIFLIISQKNIYDINHCFHNTSYIHRLYIWHSNAKDIAARPLIGHGLNSSRYRYETLPTQELVVKGSDDYYHAQAPETCLHPHNVAIQIWYELGAIGIFLLSLVFYYLLQAIAKSHPKYLTLFLGFYTTSQFIAWFSVGFWQNWWLILLFLSSAMLSRLNKN